MATRILIYSLSFRSGIGKSMLQYANTLAAYGFKVTIVASRTEPHFKSALEPSIELHLLAAERSAYALPGLLRTVRRVRPDLVFAFGVGSMLPLTVAIILARHSCPMVLREANSPAGLFASYGPIRKFAKMIAMRDAYRRADRIICLTEGMKQELISDWGMPEQKLTLIPNGVDLPSFDSAPRSLGEPPTILCVARLTAQKDIPTLLRAFALLRARRACQLQIAGDGTDRQRLESLSIELGISDYVTFLGHVVEASPLFREAHVSVLSSVYEGFPNTMIESLAQGCPVIATDCPTGPAEVIDSDAVGYLARMRDPEDLAAKLELALDRKYDAGALRTRAEFFSETRLRERVQAFFAAYVERDPDREFDATY